MDDILLNDFDKPLKHVVEKLPNNYDEILLKSRIKNKKLQDLKNCEKVNKTINQMEEGFNLYFNGANNETKEEKLHKKRNIKSSGDDKKSRKQWDNVSRIGFATERGQRLYVSPEIYYSENFEESDDSDYEIDEDIQVEKSIIMDLSMNELKILRKSLKNPFQDLQISEHFSDLNYNTDNKIFCLELKTDSDYDFEKSIDIKPDEKFQAIINKIVNMNETQQGKLLNSLEKIENSLKPIEIKFEILDNWGNPSKVGLTEISFQDINGKSFPIASVKLNNTTESINSLVNGKKDTAKSKDMWLYDGYKSFKSAILTIQVMSPAKNVIKRMAVWNFNKEPLNAGVKRIRISIDNEIWGETLIEKSFGNPGFNPPSCLKFYKEIEEKDEEKDEEDEEEEYKRNDNDVSTVIQHNIEDEDEDEECLMDQLMGSMKSHRNSSARSRSSVNLKALIADFDKIYDKPTSRPVTNRLSSQQTMISLDKQNDSLDACLAKVRQKSAGCTPRPADSKSLLSDALVSSQGSSISPSDQPHQLLDNAQDQQDDYQDCYDDDEEFTIPYLPEGSVLAIDIFTTWGDQHYVGLTGIELFSDCSDNYQVSVNRITADPSDINVLAGYSNDPRVVTNLLDGVNRTNDDLHMWLAPFTQGRIHRITIEFNNPYRLALMRIWNYNKSIIHSTRGARHVAMYLDSQMIFRGEICQAGSNSHPNGEVILFTDKDELLDAIGSCDTEYNNNSLHNQVYDNSQHPHQLQDSHSDLLQSLALRPQTADRESNTQKPKSPVTTTVATQPTHQSIERPFTSVFQQRTKQPNSCISSLVEVKLIMIESWSTSTESISEMGVTGLEFCYCNSRGDIIALPVVRHEQQSSFESDGAVDRMFKEDNITTDPDQMVCFILDGNQPRNDSDDDLGCLQLKFSIDASLGKPNLIRFWNYNKSEEDSYKGVKRMQILLNGECVIANKFTNNEEDKYSFLLRKAPGHIFYDFMQELLLYSNDSDTHALDEYYRDWGQIMSLSDDTQHLPSGFVFQLNLFSSWNDLYYIGLCGIELFDHKGNSIKVHPSQIFASPDSVNCLTPKSERQRLGLQTLDVRTPDKLIDGLNAQCNPKHEWLAPILPGLINRVWIVFHWPVCLSKVYLWNYTKTPSRGVKDFSILIDDLVVYSGVLPQYLGNAALTSGILPGMNPPPTTSNSDITPSPSSSSSIPPRSNPHRTVLLDANPSSSLLQSERGHILHNSAISSGATTSDVILTDSPAQCQNNNPPNQNLRPVTSLQRQNIVSKSMKFR